MEDNYKKQKKQLLEKGYCVISDLFDADEIENMKKKIELCHSKESKTFVNPIHEEKEYWEIIFEEKIHNIAKYFLSNENVCYLFNAQSHFQQNKDIRSVEWHRDNVCRRFGYGPDWDKEDPYNVLRIGIYLSPKENNTGINVIPYTHLKNNTISSYLRIFHWRLKRYKFFKNFRNLFRFFTGKNIYTKEGDCVIFFANLLHAALPTKKDRKNIFLSFGTNNIHAENYVNYYSFYRKELNFIFNDNSKLKDKFFSLLKENKIFFPIPKHKKDILGASNKKD